jgi:hypothetical protein
MVVTADVTVCAATGSATHCQAANAKPIVNQERGSNMRASF